MIKFSKTKSIVAMIVVVFMIFTAAGCGNSGGTGSSAAKGDLTFAYLGTFLSHEFYQRALIGMNQEANDNGVELLVADANNDVGTQVGHLETYISQGVDAILITAVDPNAVTAQIDKAKEAGIVIISDGMDLGGSEDTMVGNDWYVNGKMLGEWLVADVQSKGIEPNILCIALPTLPIIVDLENGFKDAVKNSGIEYKYTSVDGQGMKEVALVKATDALTANPDVNVIFGINDDSVLGGIQAAKTLGLDPTKMITLTNGLEGNAGCSAMKEEGTLTVACALFPEIYGAYFVKAALERIGGKELPKLYESPSSIVTKDQISQFYEKEGSEYILNYENALALLNK